MNGEKISLPNYHLTKPTYTECHATDKGWVDTKTGELLVAIKDLTSKLSTTQESIVKPKRGGGRPKGAKNKPKELKNEN